MSNPNPNYDPDNVRDEDITDDEANEMGLEYMEQETERCAKAFMEAVKKWAEVANVVIAQNS